MVCFGQSIYTVPYADLENFIFNATRYYPGIQWTVSIGDLHINAVNLAYAVEKLRAAPHDIITFDTGRVWDSLAFWEALPRFNPSEVSAEVRAKLSPQARMILGANDDENMDQRIDWTLVPQLITLIHEASPVVSYYALPSRNMILYQDTTHKYEPHLIVITTSEDGMFRNGCDPHIIFDMDDGFCSDDVPVELTTAFQEWVANGRVGPVLKH